MRRELIEQLLIHMFKADESNGYKCPVCSKTLGSPRMLTTKLVRKLHKHIESLNDEQVIMHALWQ